MTTQLKVEVFEPEADPGELDGLTRRLRLELLELDVASVSPVISGPAPADSKGPDVAAIGALLVHVAGSVSAVTTIINALRSWLRRDSSPQRSITVSIDGQTLELTSATDTQQQQLIDQFLHALSDPEPPSQ